MLLRDAPERLGSGRREVSRLVREGTLRRLDRYLLVGGCHADAAARDPRRAHRLRVEALLATYPECAASHESAAILHDLPLFRVPSYAVGTRPWGAWRGGSQARVRIAPLPAHHLTEVQGLLATAVPRTVIDVARTLPGRDAVVVGDAVIRTGWSRAQLIAVLNDCGEWSDVGKARRAVDFFDERVIMHEYDVPPPELQREITAGGERYRVDFYWEEQRTVGEADGRAKYSMDTGRTPEEAAWREKVREDALRDAGYRVVRWTYDQMLNHTDDTIARILRRLA
jgi:hypothetical protein